MWLDPLAWPADVQTARDRPTRRPAARSDPRRRRRSWRPGALEALEGRALLAASGFDLTFGSNGVVVGPVQATPTGSSAVAAIAVQGDGKIVTAEVDAASGASTAEVLVIRRYTATGALDSSFGTQGATTLDLGGASIATAPHNLAITASGQILVAAEATTAASGTTAATTRDVVARLTSAGALDTSFGTNGVVTLPASVTGANSVVVEGSGRVVVAGITPATTGASDVPAIPEATLVGLTSAGALDPSFGTQGQVFLGAATAGPEGQTVRGSRVEALRLAPSGQLVLGIANTIAAQPGILPGPMTDTLDVTLSRFGADGAIDATFGTGGTLDANTTAISPSGDFAVAADGSIILAGALNSGGLNHVPALVRVTADGAVDPAFRSDSVDPFAEVSTFVSVAIGPDGSITALSSNFFVFRFTSTGALDTSFGGGGQVNATIPAIYGATTSTINALALTPNGKVLVGGGFHTTAVNSISSSPAAQSYLAQLLPTRAGQVINDYTGDGRSDIAAELAQFGAFAYRPGTSGDQVQPFGPAGADGAIPAPGDYDGDGKADIAAYLPAFGVLAYRPSSGGADVYVRFGPTGVGNAIPAPGDYDGDGRTDVALYLPASGTFIISPSSGPAPYAVQFGAAGAGNSIPAPGDYNGDGRTDLAVYLPQYGILAYRPSGTSTTPGTGTGDVYVPFGATGAGNTLPAPGDYDGDGKTDVAAYLPQYGVFAYRSSNNKGDVLTSFGPAGAGAAIPVPGDYDGDGKADIALYLPGSATFAIDPSGSGVPYAAQFGAAGAGNTIPATSVVLDQGTVSSMGLGATAGSDSGEGVPVYLPDDLAGPPTARKKPTA